MTTIMKIDDMSYKLGNKNLLKSISWEIQEGENWIVFGLNGSGKTTLLSIVSGYMPVEAGKLKLLGESVTDENRQRLCSQIGFVSESFFSRYFHNETADDIVFGGFGGQLGRNAELSTLQIRRAKELLRKFELHEKARKPFWLLSKGERQKVLLVRALLQRPRILFLDEPCSGLDVFARLQMLELFENLSKEEKISLVCVTHHFDEVTNVYNKAMLLRQGAVHSQGTLEKILDTENISDFFSSKVQISFDENNVLSFNILDEKKKLVLDFPVI